MCWVFLPFVASRSVEENLPGHARNQNHPAAAQHSSAIAPRHEHIPAWITGRPVRHVNRTPHRAAAADVSSMFTFLDPAMPLGNFNRLPAGDGREWENMRHTGIALHLIHHAPLLTEQTGLNM